MPPNKDRTLGLDATIQGISETSTPRSKASVNILPCRIHHDGPVDADKRYWDPATEDGKLTAYLRGRRLLGRETTFPPGYTGALLRKTDRVSKDNALKMQALEELESKRLQLEPHDYMLEEQDLQRAVADGELDGDDVYQLHHMASFGSLTVWNHDQVPDDKDDPFARGIEEWVAVANAINSTHEESCT